MQALDRLCEESQESLKITAQTCIAFIKFYRNAQRTQPHILTDDDHGLFKICESYMTVYCLLVKGDVPRQHSETTPTLQ